MNEWHRKSSNALLEELRIDPALGLSEEEATSRLAEFGPNELAGSAMRSAWRILVEQLSALMVLILIGAAIISALLRDLKDAIAIAVIVLLNCLLGFSQEYRAEKAIAALKKLTVPSVKVRRGGEVRILPASLLVPGDIVLLEAGNFVPADCRVLESVDLQIQEAALTGESVPIRKTTAQLNDLNLPLGDRTNMAYMGTFVQAGRGQVIVVATGMRTELGHIAHMVETISQEPIPLQRRLDQMGKKLAAIALLIVAVIFITGLIRGENLRVMFLTAVSIGVAAIPEGLPAVVTIALTLGAQRMLARKVLIRKLAAVETLGSVTTICSDKTGTLTENRMSVTVLELPGRKLDVPSTLKNFSKPELDSIRSSGFGFLLAGMALCTDVVQQANGNQSGSPVHIGDPMEIAIVAAAGDFTLSKTALEHAFPRVAEFGFTSERKRMTTIHKPSAVSPSDSSFSAIMAASDSTPYIAFTKGAPASLLQISTSILVDGKIQPLDPAGKQSISQSSDALAQQGFRILALAFRPLSDQPSSTTEEAVEQNVTFVGFLGLIDPPRREAAEAVMTCNAAGIRPIMITGDHPLTARYIAGQVGIPNGKTVTGTELDRLSPDELSSVVREANVYARVAPEHKLRIVEALQKEGQIVAMTGDGVNDAPALKRADVGVAMGVTGTDVAKETADIVLLDDNFATIVSAVEEGRIIYDNVRKFIRYILATNSGEIWVMLLFPFLGMPLALLPLQILWMNLVTDGLPALALGLEPAERNTMRRPPYPPNESIFSRGLGLHVLWVGLFMGLLSLACGFGYWRTGRANWQTLLFTTLTLSQMAHVVAIRSERNSLFEIGLLSNKPLVGAVALTIVLQFAIVYVPFLQRIFQTQSLSALDLGLSILVSALILAAVESEKLLFRSRLASN